MVDNLYIVINFYLSLVQTELCVLLVILMLWLFLSSVVHQCILVVHVTLFLILNKSFYMLGSSLPLGVLCDHVAHVLVVQVTLAGWTNTETLHTLVIWCLELLLLLTPLNLAKSMNQIQLLWNCHCVPMSNNPVTSWYHPWSSYTHNIVHLFQVPIPVSS